MDEQKKNVFRTLAGLEIEFEPISMSTLVLAEQGVEAFFRERGDPIDKPTYKIAVEGGDEIEFELDADHLEASNKDGTPNEEETYKRKSLWSAHQLAVLALAREKQKVQSSVMYDALHIELPKDDGWIKRQERLYVKVPRDDPYELRRHYIETEVLKTVSDIIELTTRIMEFSTAGVLTEETLAAARQSFQNTALKTLKDGAESSGNERPGNNGDIQAPILGALDDVRPAPRSKRVAKKTE